MGAFGSFEHKYDLIASFSASNFFIFFYLSWFSFLSFNHSDWLIWFFSRELRTNWCSTSQCIVDWRIELNSFVNKIEIFMSDNYDIEKWEINIKKETDGTSIDSVNTVVKYVKDEYWNFLHVTQNEL